MKKTQIVLIAIGGVAVAGALVLGYLIWNAASAKAENAAALEEGVSAAESVMRKLPIRPENSALVVYREKAAAYDAWRTNAQVFAARGDFLCEKVTAAELKTRFVDEARRIAERPGCLDGALVKPDFGFGFANYVSGGALPPEKDLKRLQREWNDVTFVLKTLSACGEKDVGILDVRLGAGPAKVEAAVEEPQPKNKKKAKAKAKKKAQAGNAEDQKRDASAVTRFAVDALMRPSGLVKTLNALATSERFVVVEGCTFVREQDALAAKLGGDAKKSDSSGSRSSRRRRGSAAAATVPTEVAGGPVTDPATAPMLKVTLQVSVHDFDSLAEDESAKDEGASEGGAK